MMHDEQCEQRPGGEYEGRTIGVPPMPLPCHCAARDQGRRQAGEEQVRYHLSEALIHLGAVEKLVPENTQRWRFTLAAQLAVGAVGRADPDE